jgi:hypothetical protein
MILSRLMLDEEYARRVVPYLKADYFQDRTEKVIFSLEIEFFSKYNKLPTKEAVLIDLNKLDILNEDQFKEAVELVNSLEKENTDIEWCV